MMPMLFVSAAGVAICALFMLMMRNFEKRKTATRDQSV